MLIITKILAKNDVKTNKLNADHYLPKQLKLRDNILIQIKNIITWRHLSDSVHIFEKKNKACVKCLPKNINPKMMHLPNFTILHLLNKIIIFLFFQVRWMHVDVSFELLILPCCGTVWDSSDVLRPCHDIITFGPSYCEDDGNLKG